MALKLRALFSLSIRSLFPKLFCTLRLLYSYFNIFSRTFVIFSSILIFFFCEEGEEDGFCNEEIYNYKGFSELWTRSYYIFYVFGGEGNYGNFFYISSSFLTNKLMSSFVAAVFYAFFLSRVSWYFFAKGFVKICCVFLIFSLDFDGFPLEHDFSLVKGTYS